MSTAAHPSPASGHHWSIHFCPGPQPPSSFPLTRSTPTHLTSLSGPPSPPHASTVEHGTNTEPRRVVVEQGRALSENLMLCLSPVGWTLVNPFLSTRESWQWRTLSPFLNGKAEGFSGDADCLNLCKFQAQQQSVQPRLPAMGLFDLTQLLSSCSRSYMCIREPKPLSARQRLSVGCPPAPQCASGRPQEIRSSWILGTS